MTSKPLYLHSKYFLTKIMQCATNVIFALDLTGRVTMINDAGAKICGLPVEEILGKEFKEFFDEKTLEPVLVAFHKCAFYGETIADFHTRVRQPSGTYRDISFSVTPLKEDNKIIAVVGTAEDITDKLKSEKALKIYTDTLKMILTSLDAIVYVADIQTYVILFANKKLKDFIGREDLEGKLCYEVLQAGQAAPCPFCTNKFLLDEQGLPKEESYSWEFQNTINKRWLAIKDKAIYWIDGRLVRLEIAIDITESKKLNEQILLRERKLTSIINTTAEGYWEIDTSGTVIDVNTALCKMLGLQRDALIGRPIYELADAENAKILLNEHNLKYLQSNRNYNVILKNSSGADVHLRVHETNLTDEAGNVVGSFAFVTDITELLQIEGSVAKYAEQLRRSNEELKEFAYIVSHDLQEPLRKVIAFGDRLQEHLKDKLDEQGRDYLTRMQSAAVRMQQFIDDLLRYSRVMTKPKPYELIDLKTIIQEAIIDLDEVFIQTNATLVLDDLPAIEADPLQIRQLFTNLISNALKFRKKELTPLIKVACKQDVDTVEISVSDNGIGFDERFKDKLFKPFSRIHTRAEYPGTGMGLAICEKIAKRHGGSISVSSTEGKGTTFFIKLPKKHTT